MNEFMIDLFELFLWQYTTQMSDFVNGHYFYTIN